MSKWFHNSASVFVHKQSCIVVKFVEYLLLFLD